MEISEKVTWSGLGVKYGVANGLLLRARSNAGPVRLIAQVVGAEDVVESFGFNCDATPFIQGAGELEPRFFAVLMCSDFERRSRIVRIWYLL